MSNKRPLLSWFIVLILATGTGCGEASKLVADPPADDHESAEAATLTGEPTADSVIEAAQQTLRTDATGRFVRKVTVHAPTGKKSVVWHSTGRYDVESRRSRGTATVVDPSGKQAPLQFQFASDGARRFLHVPTWRCWVAVAPDDVGPITGLNPTPGHVGRPGEVAGLLRARALNFAWDSTTVVKASVPLRIAVGLISTGIYDRLSGRMSGVRVTAKVRVRSGRFVSWSVRGSEILHELVASGIRVRKSLYVLSLVKLKVKLSAAGATRPVRLPPQSDRVHLASGSGEFDPDGCEAPLV